MPELEPITGSYFSVAIEGAAHRIFVEEGGAGVPLLCLHTAGADSRQYRHLLNDGAVTDRFRVIAFDLPYHGRSTPPDGWWLKKYRLTTASYLAMIRAVWLALGLERPVVMGCSMGGAIVLKLAAELSGRADRHRRARKQRLCAGPLQRAPAPSGDPRRRAGRELHLRAQLAARARRRAGARTGGTTASRARACIRATCISTATTGTGAKTSSASTPTAARSRC